MDGRKRILFAIITKSHTELALDEMYGLQDLGYACDQFEYGARKTSGSKLGRLYVLILNAIKLLIKSYKFKPDFVYLNSRLEYVAGARDFITVFLLKIFYYRRVDVLIKSHGSDLEVLQTKKFFYSKLIFPFLKKFISGWLFLSTEELNWITTNKLLDENKLFLCKNIVRVEKFKIDKNFRRDHNLSDDSKVLLYLGRLIEQKGIHYVIDAFAKIRKRYHVTLIIVGDGEEFTAVSEKIKQLDISKDVIMTGWVNETTAAYYTANVDILLFPTFFPEGFPMVLFNSLAAGLSIVTTPTRAAIDYLEGNVNCLWVEPRCAECIELETTKLLEDKQLMEQMRINNKSKSILFTKEVVARELTLILDAIISKSHDKTLLKPKN